VHRGARRALPQRRDAPLRHARPRSRAARTHAADAHARAGRIAAAELYVAVLLLYHRINSWPLGGGLKKPPTRAEVLDAMRRHDAGGKGYLNHDEFVAASQDLFACVLTATHARAHMLHGVGMLHGA
jgi:hypothetical protein